MEPKIPKRYFIVFYAIGVVMAYKTFFGVFCIRRMLETYFYTKTTRSWMNVLQFIHGCIYYSVLGQYFNFKSHVKGTIWFHTMNCILNVVQGIVHYRLYICKDRALSIMHYIVEVLIYSNYLWRFRDATMLFIFLYVCMFTYATVGLRMTAGGRF
ncbi:GTPase SAR1 related small G protein [Enterocytozoon bieneusi H348]|nr:GTPase SAR1 related small G protein [Enterocytozoon bieneusi H348]EED42171.1 GTPase SAR1 related small G protein [Enterocytozoon bieneusi H348]EED42195.1 GTPase SAR1 related small G protein [Enterocytozoon bieneusi H348]EED43383.1 GTPase SAR1 related small G protein [Enterocytozoon bieneusi H348]|eukprot:XP_002650675.1 GTPase SAR1 related small G protein [Enterocytozoon bieneusi H348]